MSAIDDLSLVALTLIRFPPIPSCENIRACFTLPSIVAHRDTEGYAKLFQSFHAEPMYLLL